MSGVVSLIASSTETICALGYEGALVGRSHECDFPPFVRSLPVCTEAKFELTGSSREIDERVRETLKSEGSVYRTHVDLLETLTPGVIVTQEQCEICAVVLKDVEEAVSGFSEATPQIVSLAPGSLESVYAGIVEIAGALGDVAKGETLVEEMRTRMEGVRIRTEASGRSKPRVACVEWIEPLMVAGNWIPELVDVAGGVDVLGPRSKHSEAIDLDRLIAADPDVVVVMLCGWDIEKTILESEPLFVSEAAQELRAVRAGKVFYTNGYHHFNRPGPRLADSVEILGEILYPDMVDFGYQGRAWVKR